MTTPTAKAQRAYEAALRKKGLRHVTARLGEETRRKLDALAQRDGSKKAALEKAIDQRYEREITP